MPKITKRLDTSPSMAGAAGPTIADRGRAVAATRKESTLRQVERAQRSIEVDVEKNLGIYPHGEITAAEVLRRAGLDKRLLAKPRHHALREDVNRWVKDVQTRLEQRRQVVRKALTERTDAAKAEADLVRQMWVEAELEYVDTRSKLGALEKRLAELEKENARLRASVAGQNVVPLLQDDH